MKTFGFLIACIFVALTPSAHAASIHISNLTSYDIEHWDGNVQPTISSKASIDIYFDKKPDTNPDPLYYEFDHALKKVDVHLKAFVNGIWEDQSFTIESPNGSGTFRRSDIEPGWPIFYLEDEGFSANIHTWEVNGDFWTMDVVTRIYNYEYSSETAHLDFSSWEVPEPSSVIIFSLGILGLLVNRIKEKH